MTPPATAASNGFARSVAVDQVAVEERAASLAKRSLKKNAKIAGLRLSVRMMDLTTLEGKDTPGKVRALCAKALLPLDSDPTIGPTAAICVYPNMVPVAKHALRGSRRQRVEILQHPAGLLAGNFFRPPAQQRQLPPRGGRFCHVSLAVQAPTLSVVVMAYAAPASSTSAVAVSVTRRMRPSLVIRSIW